MAYGLVTTLMGVCALFLPFATSAAWAVIPPAELAIVPQGDLAPESPSPPAGDPVVDTPAAPAPEPQPEPEPDLCAAALDDVAAGGLPLPAGVDYQCPSTRFAHQGAACWDDRPCPGRAFIAINMSLLQGATPEYLRHVVAHEICHIIDFRDRGWSSEPRADACAAAYGF